MSGPEVNRPVVVLTGFAPFGADSTNPSWEAVQQLAHGWDVGREGIELVVEELPVTFAEVRGRLSRLLQEHSPQLLLPVGLAAGTPAVRLERVAVNLCDARIPDNSGEQPVDVEVVPHGAPALFTTLPVKAMQGGLAEQKLRVDLSLTAGSFVCNAAMFHALDLTHMLATRSGFIHVPDEAAMDVLAVAEVLGALIRVGIAHEGPDLAVAGGAIS